MIFATAAPITLAQLTATVNAKNVRGECESAELNNPGGSYEQIMDLTGSGKLNLLMAITDGSGNGTIKATVDNRIYESASIGVGADNWWFFLYPKVIAHHAGLKKQNTPIAINLEFQDTLKVECMNIADAVRWIAFYSLD